MRTLVVLAILGCACASAFVQYTPAVAAERARHAALFKVQAAAAAAAPDHGTSGKYHQAPTYQHTPSHQYHAGTHTQTHKSHHNTGHYNTGHYNAIPSGTKKWTGPMAATVPAGVNGQIIPVGDTAEVTAARNAFLNSYNAALTATRPAAPSHHQGQWTAPQTNTWTAPQTHSWTAPQTDSWTPPQAKWTGPMAATVPAGVTGSHHGVVSQTADVASATAAFHQAYNAAVAATTGRRY